jgi:hypothetical protein
MFSELEMLLVPLLIMLLQKVVKNPASVAKEKTIIKDLAQAASDADNAVNSTGWTHP